MCISFGSGWIGLNNEELKKRNWKLIVLILEIRYFDKYIVQIKSINLCLFCYFVKDFKKGCLC